MNLLTGPLGLLLVVIVLWWALSFNVRLQERYHCTAFTFHGVLAGTADSFCWALASGAVGGTAGERLIAGTVALAIALALFFTNRARSGSTLQGFLMTAWQIFAGLTVTVILGMIDSRKGRRK